MKQNYRKMAVVRLAVAVVLAAMLLLPQASSALAVPSSLATSEWVVTVSGLSSPICVGGSYMITVRWFPAASDSDALAPLTGPKSITISAKAGTFDHEQERSGTPSGMAVFTYTPQKAGGEVITAKAFNRDLEVDASATAQFEVEKCKYRYELYAELYDDVIDGDVAIGYLLTYRTKGTLQAPDPNQPDRLEDNSQMIRFALSNTYFSVPDCMVVTTEPGKGIGFVDVKADLAAKGMGLSLKISPPRDANWDVSNTIICDGEPTTASGVFPISSSKDPWIEKTFPDGGGSYPVKIDILEETVKNARGKGHIISYSARLTLERVVEP